MRPDVKRMILLNIPYAIVWYPADKAGWLYRTAPGELAGYKIGNAFMNFSTAFENPLPSFHPADILVGIIGALIVKAVVYFRGKNAKKFRQGEEYGSARWSA